MHAPVYVQHVQALSRLRPDVRVCMPLAESLGPVVHGAAYFTADWLLFVRPNNEHWHLYDIPLLLTVKRFAGKVCTQELWP